MKVFGLISLFSLVITTGASLSKVHSADLWEVSNLSVSSALSGAFVAYHAAHPSAIDVEGKIYRLKATAENGEKTVAVECEVEKNVCRFDPALEKGSDEFRTQVVASDLFRIFKHFYENEVEKPANRLLAPKFTVKKLPHAWVMTIGDTPPLPWSLENWIRCEGRERGEDIEHPHCDFHLPKRIDDGEEQKVFEHLLVSPEVGPRLKALGGNPKFKRKKVELIQYMNMRSENFHLRVQYDFDREKNEPADGEVVGITFQAKGSFSDQHGKYFVEDSREHFDRAFQIIR